MADERVMLKPILREILYAALFGVIAAALMVLCGLRSYPRPYVDYGRALFSTIPVALLCGFFRRHPKGLVTVGLGSLIAGAIIVALSHSRIITSHALVMEDYWFSEWEAAFIPTSSLKIRLVLLCRRS